MAHFKSATVELTSRLDERFYNALDLSIRYPVYYFYALNELVPHSCTFYKSNRFGKILLVQDMDSVDPILYPVLRKDYIYQGNFNILYARKIHILI